MSFDSMQPPPAAMTRRASERSVYEELRAQIVDGMLVPGTRLVEGALAKEFGSSRSPVRDALSRLAYEGLLERQDRAMRVRVLRAEDVIEIYEVRIALERAASRAAAERRTDLDLSRFNQALEVMQNLDEKKTDQRPKLAHGFHFVLWRAAHNDMLRDTLESVHLRVTGLSSTTLHYPERWETFSGECVSLVEAIEGRDAELAGQIAERQMINARDFRVKLYVSAADVLPSRYPAGR